jgi:acetate kinase
VDDAVLAAMEEFAFVAPAHNPPYVAAMRAFRRLAPSLPQVALFETAFFDSLDEATTTFAVPYEWTRMGVRRYGFHGASHRAASERAQAVLGREDLRHVSCHLGGSSSLAAIRSGVAVDTSFGLSPQSGLPQNNRVGDMDAFAALFVMRKLGLDVDAMARILASESGLAGIAGGSGDVRDLEDAAGKGDPRSRLALDVFVQAVRHYLGAFLVKLGGLDVITFSGGIGENSAAVRAAVCAGLSEIGIELDPGRNAAAKGEAVLSPEGARVAVLLVPADEERIVARAVARVVGGGPTSAETTALLLVGRAVEVFLEPDAGSGTYRRCRTLTTAETLASEALPEISFPVAELFG